MVVLYEAKAIQIHDSWITVLIIALHIQYECLVTSMSLHTTFFMDGGLLFGILQSTF